MPFYYDFTVDHDNTYLRFVRKIYRPLGFQKGYNFPLWVICGGAIFGFGLSRLQYFDINGIFAAEKIIQGDWYYWRSGFEHVGIILHLAGCLPPCLLVPWQFLPVVRHKAIWFHRINGYINIVLMFMSIAGAYMIARNSAGGGLETQLTVYVLGAWVAFSLFMAYINIKRLQIDQHRNWMLRAWVTAASIISLRLILMAATKVISHIGGYYFPLPCRVIDFITETITTQPMAANYPECQQDPIYGIASVAMNMYGERVEEVTAALNGAFGLSALSAFGLHVLGVEIYIRLTPAEGLRLKQVSYERQLARGMKSPGNAGSTIENWGDAPTWIPKAKAVQGDGMGKVRSHDESDGLGNKSHGEEEV